MTDKLPGAILERLSRVRSMEADLLDRVEELRGSGGAGPEAADPAARMSALPLVTSTPWRSSPAGCRPSSSSRTYVLFRAAASQLSAPATGISLKSEWASARSTPAGRAITKSSPPSGADPAGGKRRAPAPTNDPGWANKSAGR